VVSQVNGYRSHQLLSGASLATGASADRMASKLPRVRTVEATMTEVSKQFSLREIVGNVAPGVMVLLAVLYVLAKIPEIGSGSRVSGWSALLVGFVIAYGLGALLTSLTKTVFEMVTQLRSTAARSVIARDFPDPAESSVAARAGHLLKRAATHLGGGQDIAAAIRTFRQSWQERAVAEGVLSDHALALASLHYRSLFDASLAGEESLLFCEFYVRERMPTAMIEIEQNAAQAALMGNLIIPMLIWLVAVGIGIVLTVLTNFRIARTILEVALFGGLFAAFPVVVRAIGRQWIEASRNYVKIVIVAFVIACRLNPADKPAAV
jgi:hypothetical protein